MRTPIFLGLTSIADAIRPDWLHTNERTIAFISVTFVVMVIMDVFDFAKNMKKKN